MTLKEELEILRGEPIKVFEGDPMDIPCIETSDLEKLCKNPVVSVHMITYNHEPYIRQAIEGVMMQKTDFKFELVIGEDCSQDKTREICFEYQKKYPDKIRVLWWHENVLKLGGNGRRTRAHCRGEFIAFCEGDDYWIDPLKLQKQVDVMRKYPNVGFCFCGAKIYHGKTNVWEKWNENFSGFTPGLISRCHYVLWTMFGKEPVNGARQEESWQMTVTFLMRKTILDEAMHKFDIFSWRLWVGDSVLCLGTGSCSDVYYIPDEVAVYRQMPSGATCSRKAYCIRDTLLVRFYYFKKLFNGKWSDIPDKIADSYVRVSLPIIKQIKGLNHIRSIFNNTDNYDVITNIFLRHRNWWWNMCFLYEFGLMGFWKRTDILLTNYVIGNSISSMLLGLYKEANCCIDERLRGRKSILQLIGRCFKRIFCIRNNRVERHY